MVRHTSRSQAQAFSPGLSLVHAGPAHHLATRSPVLRTRISRGDDRPLSILHPDASAVVAMCGSGDQAFLPSGSRPVKRVPLPYTACRTGKMIVAGKVEYHRIASLIKVQILDVAVPSLALIITEFTDGMPVRDRNIHNSTVSRRPGPPPVGGLKIVDVRAGVDRTVDMTVESRAELAFENITYLIMARLGLGAFLYGRQFPVRSPHRPVKSARKADGLRHNG